MPKSTLDEFEAGMKESGLVLDGNSQYTAISNNPNYRFVKKNADFAHLANAVGAYVYGFLDLKQIFALTYDKEPEYNFPEDVEYDLAKRELIALMDYIEMSMSDLDKVQFALTLTDNSRNSLELLMVDFFQLIAADKAREKAIAEYEYDVEPYDDVDYLFDE